MSKSVYNSLDRPLNSYNLFYILEKALILQCIGHQSLKGDNKNLSQAYNANFRFYSDLPTLFPPRPPRYLDLDLSEDWFMHGKRQGKRKHNSPNTTGINPQDMTSMIAMRWKSVDAEVRSYVSMIAKLVLQRRNQLKNLNSIKSPASKLSMTDGFRSSGDADVKVNPDPPSTLQDSSCSFVNTLHEDMLNSSNDPLSNESQNFQGQGWEEWNHDYERRIFLENEIGTAFEFATLNGLCEGAELPVTNLDCAPTTMVNSEKDVTVCNQDVHHSDDTHPFRRIDSNNEDKTCSLPVQGFFEFYQNIQDQRYATSESSFKGEISDRLGATRNPKMYENNAFFDKSIRRRGSEDDCRARSRLCDFGQDYHNRRNSTFGSTFEITRSNSFRPSMIKPVDETARIQDQLLSSLIEISNPVKRLVSSDDNPEVVDTVRNHSGATHASRLRSSATDYRSSKVAESSGFHNDNRVRQDVTFGSLFKENAPNLFLTDINSENAGSKSITDQSNESDSGHPDRRVRCVNDYIAYKLALSGFQPDRRNLQLGSSFEITSAQQPLLSAEKDVYVCNQDIHHSDDTNPFRRIDSNIEDKKCALPVQGFSEFYQNIQDQRNATSGSSFKGEISDCLGAVRNPKKDVNHANFNKSIRRHVSEESKVYRSYGFGQDDHNRRNSTSGSSFETTWPNSFRPSMINPEVDETVRIQDHLYRLDDISNSVNRLVSSDDNPEVVENGRNHSGTTHVSRRRSSATDYRFSKVAELSGFHNDNRVRQNVTFSSLFKKNAPNLFLTNINSEKTGSKRIIDQSNESDSGHPDRRVRCVKDYIAYKLDTLSGFQPDRRSSQLGSAFEITPAQKPLLKTSAELGAEAMGNSFRTMNTEDAQYNPDTHDINTRSIIASSDYSHEGQGCTGSAFERVKPSFVFHVDHPRMETPECDPEFSVKPIRVHNEHQPFNSERHHVW